MALRDKRTKDGSKFDRVLGRRIVALRKSRSLSQEELAALLDVSPRELLSYEKGRKRVRPELLLRLGAVLHVRISAFFADTAAPGAVAPLESEPRSQGPKYH